MLDDTNNNPDNSPPAPISFYDWSNPPQIVWSLGAWSPGAWTSGAWSPGAWSQEPQPPSEG